MSEPRFGSCRDCACWMRRLLSAPGDERSKRVGECRRHPASLEKSRYEGCWDFIPKPAPTTEDRHV